MLVNNASAQIVEQPTIIHFQQLEAGGHGGHVGLWLIGCTAGWMVGLDGELFCFNICWMLNHDSYCVRHMLDGFGLFNALRVMCWQLNEPSIQHMLTK